MWSVNDRVFARPEDQEDWLPGTVRHVEGKRHYVILDSGEDGWFLEAQLRPLDGAGDVGAASRHWNVGDRVFARWRGDLLWYPGTVFARRDRDYHIVFDDQDQAVVTAGDLMPLIVHEGDHVLCRPKFERELRYFPAEVTRADGEIIDVVYDDLDLTENNTNVSRIRVRRSPSGQVAWEEGDPVLVSGRDDFWYPAMILVVDGDRLFAALLDNRQAWLLPEEVRSLRIKPGDLIQARKGAGQEYQPARVLETRGEVLEVRYEGSEKEATLLRLIRVPQQHAPRAQ